MLTNNDSQVNLFSDDEFLDFDLLTKNAISSCKQILSLLVQEEYANISRINELKEELGLVQK